MTSALICTVRNCGQPVADRGLQCYDCRNGRYPETRRKAGDTDISKIETSAPSLPLRITVPWSALASDNLRKGVAGQVNRAKQAEYDVALHKFRKAVAEQCSGVPVPGPLQVVAVFYMPNNLARDHHNFTKLVMDGLEGLIAVDDRWQEVRRTIMDVAGIDVDRPRCEIIIRQWEEICWLQ